MTAPEAVGRGVFKLGTGEALARIVAFSATVYLARQLGADVYGMIVLATSILLYVARVTDCGVDLLGVHDVAHDRTRLSVLLTSYLGARLSVALAASVILVAVGLTVFPQPEGMVLAAYAFALLPLALATRWAHLGLEHHGVVSLSRVATEVVTALLIVFLVHAPQDLAHVPLAQIVGEGLGAFLLLRALPKQRIVRPSFMRREAVVSLYRRSWPLVLYSLLGLVIYNSDLFFLRIFWGSATVGYYAVAYALISFVINVGNSYSLTLMPLLSRSLEDPDRERDLFHTGMAQAFAGALPVAIGACLVAEGIVQAVFGHAYDAAITPLRLLVWSIPVSMCRSVAQSVLITRGRQDQLLQTATWAAGANLVLNLALIPVWGMMGAAVATLTTASFRAALQLRFVRAAGVPMAPLSRFWKVLIAGGIMAAVVLASGSLSVWLVVLLGAAVYGAVLTVVGGLRLRFGRLPELTV